jgi:phosphate transport system substrate-binding protein
MSDLVDHQVAIVVFAVILNKHVTGIHKLSTAQLQSMYTGAYLNWRQVCNTTVCGPDMNIHIISRATESGSRFTFEKYVLKSIATMPDLELRYILAEQTIQEVEHKSGSISYVPLRLAQHASDITIVSIDGHHPTDPTFVANSTYRFWSIEHMYTKGAPTPLAQAFLTAMSSESAKQYAHQLGYLSLNDIPLQIRERHEEAIW